MYRHVYNCLRFVYSLFRVLVVERSRLIQTSRESATLAPFSKLQGQSQPHGFLRFYVGGWSTRDNDVRSSQQLPMVVMIMLSMTRQYASKLCPGLILIIFVCNALRTLPHRDPSELHLRNRAIAGAIRGAAPYIESSTKADVGLCKKSSQLSLWLMPPDETKSLLQREIDSYAENAKGPSFPPHVTIVGGIPCESADHINETIRKLQDGLAGFGEVTLFHKKALNFSNAWNQALVIEMQLTPRFEALCRKSRIILGMETEKDMFPQPVSAPHLSLFYGISNVPDANGVEPIPDFDAITLALWMTDPPTLEGVPQWKQVGSITLV
jgi:hypothetical protein